MGVMRILCSISLMQLYIHLKLFDIFFSNAQWKRVWYTNLTAHDLSGHDSAMMSFPIPWIEKTRKVDKRHLKNMDQFFPCFCLRKIHFLCVEVTFF
jgi:hypothetical protein